MGNINSSLSSVWRKAFAWVRKLGQKTDIVVTDSLFPPEIIMEILSWLPVEFQGRVMLVCKQWYALIRDRHFIENHMKRNHEEFKYVLYYVPTTNGDKIIYNDVCVCDGLYLQKNRFTNKYRIRNPVTKQVLELPDPHKGSHSIVFSYVPSTRNYKFVSIYDDESSIECCEIFSVENDEFSWRPLKMPTGDYLIRNRKKFFVVSTCDAVHCVRVIASGAVMVEEVVSLDLATEQFTVTKFPEGRYKSWEKVWPLNFMGKLALVDRIEEDLCVLVLEDYKKQKWGKRKSLISSTSMKFLEDKHGTIFPYSVDQLDKLLFLVKDRMFIVYNVNTGEEQHLTVQHGKMVGKMHPQVYSLVRLKGMQPEEKTPTQPLPLS